MPNSPSAALWPVSDRATTADRRSPESDGDLTVGCFGGVGDPRRAREKQEEECQKQKVRIEREMVAVVRGVAFEDLDDGSYYGRYSNDVDQAIDKRKAVVEDELLAQTDLGRQILKLRAERESLLDDSWPENWDRHRTSCSEPVPFSGDFAEAGEGPLVQSGGVAGR